VSSSASQLELNDEVLQDTADQRVIQRFTPMGVVAGIVPWNFPLLLATSSLSSSCGICLHHVPDMFTSIAAWPCGAGIVPWNFPLLLAVGKIAPAVYTGNCIIIKPSPFTPYCALKIGESPLIP
jgi:acyl-CoA reductase-like NAD-dependent aldehyde dehydrogenase